MIFSERPDQFADLSDLSRVKPDGRFIQDQDRRIPAQGLRNPGALPVALGEMAEEAVPDFTEPAQVHDIVHMMADPRLFHFSEAAYKHQVIPDRHFIIQRRTLRKIAEMPAAVPSVFLQVQAVNLNAAGSGRHAARHNIQKGRLSGPVHTEQTCNPAVRAGEGYIRYGSETAVILGD